MNAENDQLSTAIPQVGGTAFLPIRVVAKRLPDLIRKYGVPLYIKLDIEGMDDAVLGDIFQAGYMPHYISAEAHSIRTFVQLVAAGYCKFKIVEGRFVHRPYYKVRWTNKAGDESYYEFPWHSSGPFGDDIPGPWLDVEDILQYLARYGVGWKDIHASQ